MAHYNYIRLNSAIGYITPKDMLAGRHAEIHAPQDRKLAESRKQRRPDSSSEGRVKHVGHAFRFAGEVDDFRVADNPDKPSLSHNGTWGPHRPNPSFVRVARDSGRGIPKLLLPPVHVILIVVARLRHALGDGLGAIQKIMQGRLSI